MSKGKANSNGPCAIGRALLGAAVIMLGLIYSSQASMTNSVINVNFTPTSSLNLNGTSWSSTVAPLPYVGNVWTDFPDGGGNYYVNLANLPYSDSALGLSGVGSVPNATILAMDANWNNGTPLTMLKKGGDLGVSGTLTLTGLAPTDYNIYLIANGGYQNQYGGTFTIGGVSRTSAGSQYTSWQEGSNYVRFTNLTPDINNQIAVNFAPYNGYFIFNGFQLEVLPEPSSAMLLGLGGLLVWRRSRSTANGIRAGIDNAGAEANSQ